MLYTLSVFLGVIFGVFFYDIIINLFNFDSDIVFWITLVLFIILFVFIQSKWECTNLIIITSLFGSYMTVRAFSLFQDNYPDEVYIASLFHHRELKQINRIFETTMLVYLLAIIVLFLFGFLIQYNNIEDESKKGDEES